MAQRISRAKALCLGRRLDQPGDLAVVLRVLYLIYTAGPRAGRPGRRGDRLAASSPRHGGTRGARAARTDTPQPRRAPGAARPTGPDRHARPTGPRPVGHPRDRRGRARPAVRAGDADRRAPRVATRSRPRSPPCTTTRPAPRRPTGRRSWPGTTTSSAHRRPGPPGPRRGVGRAVAVGRVLGAGAGLRETDRLARRSATGTAGTPCAATCTSSAATSPPPPGLRRGRPPGHERRRARPPDSSNRPLASRLLHRGCACYPRRRGLPPLTPRRVVRGPCRRPTHRPNRRSALWQLKRAHVQKAEPLVQCSAALATGLDVCR